MNIWTLLNFVFTQVPVLNWFNGYKRIIGFVVVCVALLDPVVVQFTGISALAIPADYLRMMLEWGSGILGIGVAAAVAKTK